MNTKDKRDKFGCTDFSCNPHDFQGMFGMMNKCCAGQGVSTDWRETMKSMMETMKNQSCCGPRKEDTKTDKRKQ